MKTLLQIFVFAGMVFAFGAVTSAQAQVVITDDFTPGSSDTDLSTHHPEVSPDGEGYVAEGSWSAWGTPSLTTQGGQTVVGLQSDEGAALSFSGVASNDPTISANIEVGTIDNTYNNTYFYYYGVFAGFFSTDNPPDTSGVHGSSFFYGLIVSDNGSLSLFSAPAGVLQTVAAPSDFDFNPDQFYTLSYTIDRTTGDLSNVTLGGYAYAFNSTTIFTPADTEYAGFGAAGSGASQYGYVNTFTVTPEPSTWALLACGSAFLAALYRRRLSS